MKKTLIIAILAVLVGVFPAHAATVTAPSQPTARAVVKVDAVKKTTSKVAPKKVATTIKSPAFSAEAARESKNASGAKPPEGYMEALKKAEDDYYAAVKAAAGNKAKLKAASDRYDEALTDAMKLLD